MPRAKPQALRDCEPKLRHCTSATSTHYAAVAFKCYNAAEAVHARRNGHRQQVIANGAQGLA